MSKICENCGYYCSCNPCCQCGHTKGSPTKGPIEPTTQKSKGLLALKQFGFHPVLPIEALIKVKEGRGEIVPNSVGSFARPCPPTPEHGFVESRVIKTAEELDVLIAETLNANEASEIMLTPPVKADWNLVWTPRMVSVGPGHDGATAGKGAFSLPLAGVSPFTEDQLAKAGIDSSKGPYVEAVWGLPSRASQELYIHQNGSYSINSWIYTQLRGGPKMESIQLDFVPADVVVSDVIKTNGEDLLEWAKVVRGLRERPGAIVYHPGGSPVDHYSVHCRENNVPILTTRIAVVGEVLNKNTETLAPLDPHAMALGIAAVDATNVHSNKMSGHYTRLALLALHNSSVLRGEHSYFIGVALACMAKLGAAALEAEARHVHASIKGMTQKPDIYEYYCGKSLSFLRARLSRITQLLHYGWGEEGEQGKVGFGGIRWALCGAALCPVFNAIRDLILNPTQENASNCLLALNISVNQAHNGGWWLNKYADPSAYVEVPKGNIPCLGSAMIAARAINEERPKADVYLEKLIKRASKWPETVIHPLKFRKASLDIGVGTLELVVKAATVPNPRKIIIPATSTFVKKILTSAKGGIEIVPGSISLVTPDGEKYLVWAEKQLAIEARDALVKKDYSN